MFLGLTKTVNQFFIQLASYLLTEWLNGKLTNWLTDWSIERGHYLLSYIMQINHTIAHWPDKSIEALALLKHTWWPV